MTPLLESPLLNRAAGRRVLVKAECLQKTGSFKFRGGWSAVSALPDEVRRRGVIAYSSGNHAQGVAHAARTAGACPAVIVMPNDAPALKLANTAAHGAEVVTYDRPGGENREAIGEPLAEERGLTLIRPYDEPMVIAGQGTCGLEIAEQAPRRRRRARRRAGLLRRRRADLRHRAGARGRGAGHARPPGRARGVRTTYAARSPPGIASPTTAPSRSICDAIVTPQPGRARPSRSCSASPAPGSP